MVEDDESRMKFLKDMKKKSVFIPQAEDWTSKQPLLAIENLHAEAAEDGQRILSGVNLVIYEGETHAIMGRNGSGKSTLVKVLAGHPKYKVTKGTIFYKGLDLLKLDIQHRALAGIFLAFQYPVEIPMLKNSEFLRVAINEKRKVFNMTEVDPFEFNIHLFEQIEKVGLPSDFIEKPVNYGFSGGEKKRNEILQMLVLDPILSLLDETDSGLDVDSFNITATALKNFRTEKKSFLIVTHYKRLLDLLQPQIVHVMHGGKIITSGGMEVPKNLEQKGFNQYLPSVIDNEEEDPIDKKRKEEEELEARATQ